MPVPPSQPDDDGSVDVDAQFKDIVGRLGDLGDTGNTSPGDAATNPNTNPSTNIGDPDAPPRVIRDDNDDWGATPASRVGGNSAREYSVAPEDDTFIPPEPPPLRLPSPKAALTWLPVVVVPLFFLYCAFFWRAVPQAIIGVGAVLFVVATGLLIFGLRDDEDQDPGDDGARV